VLDVFQQVLLARIICTPLCVSDGLAALHRLASLAHHRLAALAVHWLASLASPPQIYGRRPGAVGDVLPLRTELPTGEAAMGV
jgi:hypothetical protein